MPDFTDGDRKRAAAKVTPRGQAQTERIMRDADNLSRRIYETPAGKDTLPVYFYFTVAVVSGWLQRFHHFTFLTG